MITIHHLGMSQSDRVVWLMEELGLPYTLKWYDRGPDFLAPPEYRKLHGAGTAPIIEDDGGQPATAEQKIEKLINDDKVVALVGIQSPTRNWLPFAEQSGVPILGGFVSSGEYVDHVNMFAANGTGGRIGPFATLSALKSVGGTKIGIMACAEVPACAQAAAPYEAMAPSMEATISGEGFSMLIK